MPVILAKVIRSAIGFAITLAIYTTAESFLKATLDRLPKAVSDWFGITEEEAQDFLHDFMIAQALAFGITVLAMRKRMPQVAADKLGFTSKGFSSAVMKTATKAKIEATTGVKVGTDLMKGWGSWSFVVKIMGSITAVWMLTQSIEVFAYRPRFFTNILSFVGLEKVAERLLISPPKPLFSDTEIRAHAQAFFKAGSGPLSFDYIKQLFEAAEDTVRGNLENPTQARVLAVIKQDLLNLEGGPGLNIATGTKEAGRALRGTVAQDTIGTRVPFDTPDEDFIDTDAELRAKARETLMSFLRAIPGRIIYEVKLVTSYIDKNGLRRRAEWQEQVIGTNENGTPKTKRLLNRIAIIDIYAVKGPGSRTRIDRLVLGPTDAFGLTSGTTELAALSSSIRDEDIVEEVEEEVKAPEDGMFSVKEIRPGDSRFWKHPEGIVSASATQIFNTHEISPEEALDYVNLAIKHNGRNIPLPGGNFNTWPADIGRALGITLPPEPGAGTPIPQTKKPEFPRDVTVNTAVLFVRAAPSVAAPLAGSKVLNKGNVFSAVAVVEGQAVEGESRWWQSSKGNFVWVGGTAEKP